MIKKICGRSFLWMWMILLLLVNSSTASALPQGATIPNTILQTMDGAEVSMSSFRGRYVYLDFWASWCPPCRIALPFLNELHGRFSDKNLSVVAVNIDAQLQDATAVLQKVQPRFTSLRDADQKLISECNPPKMPSSFIIDPHGVIVSIHAGFAEDDKGKIVLELETLLSEKGRNS